MSGSLLLALERWAALLRPVRRVAPPGGPRNRDLLVAWSRRWQAAHAELRGPAIFFAQPEYWEAEFARAEGAREWVTAPAPEQLSALDACAAARRAQGLPFEVLHAGCGTSDLAALILHRFPHAVVTNVDASSSAIEAARRRRPSCERCRWAVADALELPAAFGTEPRFDAVVDKGLVDSLLHGGAFVAAAYVQGAAQLLRLGGAFVSISDETNVASRSQFLNAALHGCDGLAREVEHISRDGHAVYVAQRLLSNTSIE